MPQFVRNYLTEFFSDSLANIDFSYFNIVRISFFDIIDILIVAYFLYKIILWIKETRAWALFKGIATILLISAFSFMFGLTTISWFIKTTLSVGVLALIIIFQPELRKALEQLGKGRISFPFNISSEDGFLQAISEKNVDAIIKAAFKMAKVKTGALILIENDVKLGEFEQTGTLIDALISEPLLISIFEDKTPLHDGAVIIRNNRIAAGSCILPLTETEIGRDLGTRHRAAVGISEISDCYALVVSEESGKVSLALNGKLYKGQTKEQLKEKMFKEKSTLSKKRFVIKRGSK